MDPSAHCRSKPRGVRPELEGDDFDEYFDLLCPALPPFSPQSDAASVGTSVGDGSYSWKTSLSEISFDLPREMPLRTVGGSDANHNDDNLWPDTQYQRGWAHRREMTKAGLRKREDAAVEAVCGRHDIPTGLARACHRVTLHMLPLRIWLVDNSGSMATGDGRRFLDGSRSRREVGGFEGGENGGGGKKEGSAIAGRVSQMVNCTRWEELRGGLVFHAELSSELMAPTLFRLINDPGIAARERRRGFDDDANDETSASAVAALPQVVGVCVRKVGEERRRRRPAGDGGRTVTSGRLLQLEMLRKIMGRRMSCEERGEGNSDGESQHWVGKWEIDPGTTDDLNPLFHDRAQEDLERVKRVIFEVRTEANFILFLIGVSDDLTDFTVSIFVVYLMKIEPRYRTPLSQHMWAIHRQVESVAPFLKKGQKVRVLMRLYSLLFQKCCSA